MLVNKPENHPDKRGGEPMSFFAAQNIDRRSDATLSELRRHHRRLPDFLRQSAWYFAIRANFGILSFAWNADVCLHKTYRELRCEGRTIL